MSILFYNKSSIKKRPKLIAFSPKVWRSMFMVAKNPLYINAEKRIRTRSSAIPITYYRREIIIHAGKRWHTKYVNRWMVGFKFGEFTWNRKFAQYKAKKKRKKNKK